MSTVPKSKKSNLKRIHKYYSLTGFYSFVGLSLKRALPPIIGFVVLVLFLNEFVIDFSAFFTEVTNTYAPVGILTVFFASESLLGLIPPEIFIAWADKTASPLVYLSLLAILSYMGGIVSYFIGKLILRIPSVYNYVEVKMEKHLRNVRKWGGFLIIVGALLPIPFSMTSMMAGTINYSFRNYLLFGSLRFVRFYLFAIAIFNLV
ncbi:membrane protein YqaA with SNARE-associated domain [Ulvibacter sp. MAR_2010_11]|uniref:YqaA family protein n=1 Tax=Ulvibacter sp. MAR_2010_11 TaxID=1250229 RepID=UPI000C2C5612|nr:VTT domain-containing protein [Ulvibacter sp. MAR_2010_11]PKA84141.1 membrane protein YqaA with SNARE-associated domain [Ulvibacter sp. MAR_2010_11]